MGVQVGDDRTGPGQEPKWTGHGGQTGLGVVFVQNRAQGSGLGIGRGWGGEGREGSCPWDGDPEEEQTAGDVEASVSHSKEPGERAQWALRWGTGSKGIMLRLETDVGLTGPGARAEAVGLGEMDVAGCEAKLRGPRAEP